MKDKLSEMQPPSPMRALFRGIPENRARDVSAKYKYRINSNWPNGKIPIKPLQWNIKLAASPRFPVFRAVYPQCWRGSVPQLVGCHPQKGCWGGRGQDHQSVSKSQIKAMLLLSDFLPVLSLEGQKSPLRTPFFFPKSSVKHFDVPFIFLLHTRAYFFSLFFPSELIPCNRKRLRKRRLRNPFLGALFSV